ncbi:MAG: 30S ribosomal protein S16 [Planctomycetes bacterium]|nr:30S ribosomal protein S16 [Planctomycetota bacterium]
MAVSLRLMRIGKTNRPSYRLCAVDSRKPRGGAYIESFGFYDPFIADDNKKVTIDRVRAEYWLSVGARPSETVMSFLRKAQVSGLTRPKKPSRRRPKREGKTALKGKAGQKAKKAAQAKATGRKPRWSAKTRTAKAKTS